VIEHIIFRIGSAFGPVSTALRRQRFLSTDEVIGSGRGKATIESCSQGIDSVGKLLREGYNYPPASYSRRANPFPNTHQDASDSDTIAIDDPDPVSFDRLAVSRRIECRCYRYPDQSAHLKSCPREAWRIRPTMSRLPGGARYFERRS